MKTGKASKPGQTESATAKETEKVLAQILAIIRSNPGIRPSDINRRLGREQTDSLRATLIRRGLVRKVKKGQATYLYAT